MRHYTEKNSYPILNSRYSTLHLKQYLNEDEIEKFEKLLVSKEYANNSEKELLDYWDKKGITFPLVEYCDRIRTSIKKINSIQIIKDDDYKVTAKVIFTTKEKYCDKNKFDLTGTFSKNINTYDVMASAALHLSYVDFETIRNNVLEELTHGQK